MIEVFCSDILLIVIIGDVLLMLMDIDSDVIEFDMFNMIEK